MKARTLATVLGITAIAMLVGPGAASAQNGQEPGPTVTIEPVCDDPERSAIDVAGSGFAPNQLLFAGLQIIEDGELVFFVDGVLISASPEGTLELSSEWDGPATYIVSIFDSLSGFIVEELFVDCGRPETKADCKDGGWRFYGFKNQGQCVASVQRGPK